MIQLRALFLTVFLANAAQAETHDSTISAIKAKADELAHGVRAADVPQMLIRSLQATGDSSVRQAFSNYILREAGIERSGGGYRLADKIAVELTLRDAWSPDEIAKAFALHADYGRQCLGWRAAISGLFNQEPDNAEDMVLIALAAQTVDPSGYRSGRTTDLKRRTRQIASIIENLVGTKFITPKRAQMLLSTPVPNSNSGPGC